MVVEKSPSDHDLSLGFGLEKGMSKPVPSVKRHAPQSFCWLSPPCPRLPDQDLVVHRTANTIVGTNRQVNAVFPQIHKPYDYYYILYMIKKGCGSFPGSRSVGPGSTLIMVHLFQVGGLEIYARIIGYLEKEGHAICQL